MKNKLMLSALAAALVAPGLAHADGHEGVTLSGVVQMYYLSTDDNTWVAGGDVRLNAGVSTTKGDYTGFANYRLDGEEAIDADDNGVPEAVNTAGSNVTSDSVTVGITGPFGTIKMGSVDGTNQGEYANDIYGVSKEEGPAIGYTNSFGDVSLTVAMSPESSNDSTGFGIELPAGPVTIGAASTSIGDADTTVFGVKGTFGGLDVAFHSYDDNEDEGTAIKIGGSAAGWSWAVTQADEEPAAGGDLSTTRVDLGTTIADVVGFSIRVNTSDDTGDFTRVGLEKSF